MTGAAEEKQETASQNIRCPGRDPKDTSPRALQKRFAGTNGKKLRFIQRTSDTFFYLHP
jgi:hypothetical protein